MGDAPLRGRLMWVELMTKDLKAAEKFYTDVVGWTITPFDGLGMPYSMFTRSGDTMIAGAMTLPPELAQHGVPPHWALYVGVDKIEPAVNEVVRLGGGALSDVMEVPTVGRMQAMRDPQGAAFSVYEPADPPPTAEAAPEVGDLSWIELMTSDATAALQFYRALFGWQPGDAMDMGPMGKYQLFGRHLGPIGGMMNKPLELAQAPPNWSIYFRVADLDAAAARVTAGGGQIVNGPMEVPGGDRIVNCMDPQGAAFSLHEKRAG